MFDPELESFKTSIDLRAFKEDVVVRIDGCPDSYGGPDTEAPLANRLEG